MCVHTSAKYRGVLISGDCIELGNNIQMKFKQRM